MRAALIAVMLIVLSSTSAVSLENNGITFRYLERGPKIISGKKFRAVRGGNATACLKVELRNLLGTISSKFGPLKIVSTCRPGAVIRGTSRPSLHRYGMAVDFVSPLKAQVVSYLRNNWHGGVMTYRHRPHIHVDLGRHFYAIGNY